MPEIDDISLLAISKDRSFNGRHKIYYEIFSNSELSCLTINVAIYCTVKKVIGNWKYCVSVYVCMRVHGLTKIQTKMLRGRGNKNRLYLRIYGIHLHV